MKWKHGVCRAQLVSRKHIDKKAWRVQGGAVASGGRRDLIPAVARACVAVGIDGIFMKARQL